MNPSASTVTTVVGIIWSRLSPSVFLREDLLVFKRVLQRLDDVFAQEREFRVVVMVERQSVPSGP